jgi:hypothetical protein
MDELTNARKDTIAVFIQYHDTLQLKMAVNDSTANSSVVQFGGWPSPLVDASQSFVCFSAQTVTRLLSMV